MEIYGEIVTNALLNLRTQLMNTSSFAQQEKTEV